MTFTFFMLGEGLQTITLSRTASTNGRKKGLRVGLGLRYGRSIDCVYSGEYVRIRSMLVVVWSRGAYGGVAYPERPFHEDGVRDPPDE